MYMVQQHSKAGVEVCEQSVVLVQSERDPQPAGIRIVPVHV